MTFYRKSRYTRKTDREAKIIADRELEASGHKLGRPKGSPNKAAESLIERDIKKIQKTALDQLKAKAATLNEMDIDSLLKVLKSCGDALKGVRHLRAMDQDTGTGTIRFETVMASRKDK